MEIYKDERAIFEAESEFKDIQNDVNEFIAECIKCKLQVNDLPQLIGLISNTKAESNAQYRARITDADLQTEGGLQRNKDEFFKTLILPNITKLNDLAIRLHPRVNRIDLGVLDKNKLSWSQGKFNDYAAGFVVKSDTELSKHLLKIAKEVEGLKSYLQGVSEEKQQNITILSNLLPNLPRLLLESGRKIYVNPTSYNELKDAIK